MLAMPARTTSAVILLTFAAAILSCKKVNIEKPDDPGKITVNVDGVAKNLKTHAAIYYPKIHAVEIFGKGDYNEQFYVFANLDSTNTVKNYVFQPNGENAVSYFINGTRYYSDHNVTNSGGNLNITMFDKAQKRLSGSFELNCYSGDRNSKINLSSGVISDLPMSFDTTVSHSYAQYNISGNGGTTHVNLRGIANEGTCASTTQPGKMNTVRMRLRNFFLVIPIEKPNGSYSILPATNSQCSPTFAVSTYQGYDKVYDVVSGTVNVISADAAGKHINATFSCLFKNASSGETIEISNGALTTD